MNSLIVGIVIACIIIPLLFVLRVATPPSATPSAPKRWALHFKLLPVLGITAIAAATWYGITHYMQKPDGMWFAIVTAVTISMFLWPEEVKSINDSHLKRTGVHLMVSTIGLLALQVGVGWFWLLISIDATPVEVLYNRWQYSPAMWVGVVILTLHDRLPLSQTFWVLLAVALETVTWFYIMYGWQWAWPLRFLSPHDHGWLVWMFPVT